MPAAPAGERAVFQPRSATFQADVGEDIRAVLEAALRQHSCLARGDWLSVPHGGQRYDLRVSDLQPEPAVSVIDTGGWRGQAPGGWVGRLGQRRGVQGRRGQRAVGAQSAIQSARVDASPHPTRPLPSRARSDLEAEINPSIETEERIREQHEAAAHRAAEAALAAGAAAAAAADQEALEAEQAAEAAAAAAAEAARRERVWRAKEAVLPLEPDAGGGQPLLTCMFRFPDGGRHSRRFTLDSPLQVGRGGVCVCVHGCVLSVELCLRLCRTLCSR